MEKKTGGRPRGRKKISKIEVLIEPEIKEEFQQILEEEGRSASGLICLWIRQYINEHREGTK